MSALVAFWNLENLFAPEGYPAREPWIAKAMQKDLKGWSETLFKRKVAQLGSIIVRMKDGAGPDILGVCEVENRYALQALADQLNQALPARNYQLVHVDSARDQRGVDTAFLYDAKQFTAKTDELFSHWVMRQTGQPLAITLLIDRRRGRIFFRLPRHGGRDAGLLAWTDTGIEGR